MCDIYNTKKESCTQHLEKKLCPLLKIVVLRLLEQLFFNMKSHDKGKRVMFIYVLHLIQDVFVKFFSKVCVVRP